MLKQQSWVLATQTEWAAQLKISTIWPFTEKVCQPLLPSVWTQNPEAGGFVQERTCCRISLPSSSQSCSATLWTGCYLFTPLMLYDRSFPLPGKWYHFHSVQQLVMTQTLGKLKIRGSESASITNVDLKHAKFLNLSSIWNIWFNRINIEPRL